MIEGNQADILPFGRGETDYDFDQLTADDSAVDMHD